MRALGLILFLPAVASAEIRFDDLTATLPVGHVYEGGWEHFVGGGVAVFDCNADGYPEILAAGGETPASLLLNRTAAPGADPVFAPAPLPEMRGVTGAYPLDIDGDGILDLAVLRVGPNVLLHGGADCHFADAGAAWGFTSGDAWTTAFSATWEESAAFPTLVFGNYVDRSDPAGPFGTCDTHDLYRPGPAGYDAPVILEPGFCTLSMLFSHGARDRMSLRLSNDRHYYVRGGAEQMWDLAEGRWLGSADGWEQTSLWGMGIASRDLTGDGLPEIMLTSMGDQLLQIAQPDGSYRDAPYGIGTFATRPHTGEDGRPSTGWHAEFGDIDNDGRADLFIAKGNVDQMPGMAMEDPNNLLMQNTDGTFREVAATAGVASPARSRGAALADLNRDGLLDLVVVNRRAPMEVHVNRSDAGRWLTVLPLQDGPNTRAVGAFVDVRVGDRWQRQEITVGGGHAGGQSGPLHFGLGAAEAAEVRIIWPEGVEQNLGEIAAGSDIVVRRSVRPAN